MPAVKHIPRQLKLKEDHSTSIKLSKLQDFAEELGIRICFGFRTVVEDRDRINLPPLYLEDIEAPDTRIEDFPITFEYKLVYKNPEFSKKEKEELELLREVAKEHARLRIVNEQARLKKVEELAAEKQIADDLAKLAELKAKYEVIQ
jgi:hypothetical protein